MTQNNVLLEVKDLKVSFYLTEATVRAVDGVNFSIEAGKTLGIVGESGCGKSVTARAILGMVRRPGKIIGGEVLYHRAGQTIDMAQLDPEGPEIRSIRWGEIAMIFQEPMTSLSPVHTIGNQMIEAVQLHKSVSKSAAEAVSVDLMRRVGLPYPERLLKSYRHELSGGMRQRVMIAMALTCSPRLLIADEPTTALDVTTQAQILDLMRDLQEEYNMAIMFITHNLGVIAEMADDVIVMYLGKEVEVADVDTIFHSPSHPYTQALLRSIPRHDVDVQRLETITGTVPDPTAVPKGCAFHPRCRHFVPEACLTPPSLLQVADDHQVRCTRAYEINEHLAAAQTE
ncbi:MAG: dipeptide/oligopeptide/nickel ABC transporter ATP-binding protein [Anaerolineaceae bacterium]|nr:dipeptide/oligopeptide/nickel ABC transporter ATP-binding protein [Anaerolineaceae bacterium]